MSAVPIVPEPLWTRQVCAGFEGCEVDRDRIGAALIDGRGEHERTVRTQVQIIARVVLQHEPGPLEAGQIASDGVPAADVAGRRPQRRRRREKAATQETRISYCSIRNPPLEPLSIDVLPIDCMLRSLGSTAHTRSRRSSHTVSAAASAPLQDIAPCFLRRSSHFFGFDEATIAHVSRESDRDIREPNCR